MCANSATLSSVHWFSHVLPAELLLPSATSSSLKIFLKICAPPRLALPARSPGSGPSRKLNAKSSPPPSKQRVTRSAAALKRSEEHTSELQSHHDLVCRLLLEKNNPNSMVSSAVAEFAENSIFLGRIRGTY